MLVRIILGWWYWITNRNNLMAAERLQHCAVCPYRKWFVCSKCGCPLQAKARIKDEPCPDGRWPQYYTWYYDVVEKLKS